MKTLFPLAVWPTAAGDRRREPRRAGRSHRDVVPLRFVPQNTREDRPAARAGTHMGWGKTMIIHCKPVRGNTNLKTVITVSVACLALVICAGCDISRFAKNSIPPGCHLDNISKNLGIDGGRVTIMLRDHHIYRRLSLGSIVSAGGHPETYRANTGAVVCPVARTAQVVDIAIDVVGRPFEQFKRLR